MLEFHFDYLQSLSTHYFNISFTKQRCHGLSKIIMLVDGREKLSKADLRDYPLLQYSGNIHVIDKIEQQISTVQDLAHQPILGFDTETRPNFRKGQNNAVSLLQLATPEDVYLFRFKNIGLSRELAEILANKNILKLGVAVRDDIIALQNLMGFTAQGFMDLADLAEQKGLNNFGLNALSVIFTGQRLSKTAKLSNWDAKELKPAQLHYAACDAYVALPIFQGLSQLQDDVKVKNLL